MSEPRTVQDLMSPEVVTLHESEPLSIADDVMKLGRIRHIPVVDDGGRLVGILSQRDLFRDALSRVLGYGHHTQSRILKVMRAKEVMTKTVASVTRDTPLSDAAARMLRDKIGCVVVVEGGNGPDAAKVVGILTESDFVKLAVHA